MKATAHPLPRLPKGGEKAARTDGGSRILRLLRRGAGASLLLLMVLPLYRLVGLRSVGPAAEQTMRLGPSYQATLWVGAILATFTALGLSRLLPQEVARRVGAAGQHWLLLPHPVVFAAVLGSVAAAGAIMVSLLVLGQAPPLLDGVSQLVHARYLAAGRLSGPTLENPEFWHFQFMVLSDGGWLSQYPPGFAAALAVGARWGAAWLVGPVLLGVTVFLTALVAERLFPRDRATARLGALLASVSPFLAFHAAAYMNHVLAVALVVAALYAALRAKDGSWLWSGLAGAAVGALFLTRPYTALVLGVPLAAGVWLVPGGGRLLAVPDRTLRLAGAAAAAAPFAAALLLYNAVLFGHPLRLGYAAAAGASHGLGFHRTPWGDPYGTPEALGYTAADLLGLSADLLQGPVPAALLVAVFLMVVPAIGWGVRVAAAWALLPVAANVFYWHHDLFMGPRLLYEAAPGWCLLLAASAVWLVRASPRADAAAPGWLPRQHGVAAMLVLGVLVAVAYAGPRKVASYRSGATLEAQADVSGAGPSIVFVHGTWESRLGSRLAALGMNLTSVRSVLGGSSTCEVHLMVDRLERGVAPAPADALGRVGPLREMTMPSGSVIRARQGEKLTPACIREASSDFRGVADLGSLVWRGDLPGLGSDGPMFVRDFGPERNRRLLARFPDREPSVLLVGEGEIRVVPYETGMADLWMAG